MVDQFKEDINNGLNSRPKTLPSKYFYDEIGDDLFVQIMRMPEYYLTRAELEIFKTQTSNIIQELGLKKEVFFELVELGAGDGTKTLELLKVLVAEGYQFSYLPVDISSHALKGLKNRLKQALPSLSVRTQEGDYFEILSTLKNNPHPKAVLFLGSNIGNMTDERAGEFIYKLGANLQRNDHLLLGVDLIKSKSVVLPAYNDPKGLTRDFNLNLLHRINVELGADFQLADFEHAPEYEESEGIAKSFLKSKKAQRVTIKAIGKTYEFEEGEKIHTEISRKYNDLVLQGIIKGTDFHLTGKLMDSKGYFADYILKRQ